MYRKALLISMLLSLIITSCNNKPNQLDGQSLPDSIHSQALIPTIEPTTSPVPIMIEEPTVSNEAIIDHNFSEAIKLPMNGYYYENLLATSKEEVILSAKKYEPDTSSIIQLNLLSSELNVVWESSSELILNNSLSLINENTVEWEVYDTDHLTYRTYRLIDNQVINVGGIKESSDGNWSVNQDMNNIGIWGMDRVTGKEEQWTTGAEDTQPLWLPDSTGFIYLRDTGEQIGDGAGPYYELAQYNIASRETSIYPFEKDFWGRIEWLEPGVSLVAYNGFDDVFALRIVNLEEEQQYQVVNSTDYVYINSFIDVIGKRLFISDYGSFKFYGSNGEVLSETTWPTGLDEYITINEQHKENQEKSPYYKGESLGGRFGPSNFRISPDGKQIAYLIGAIGESTYDIVYGTKIAIADKDAKQTTLLTQDYIWISGIQWTPDSTRIVMFFSIDRTQTYLGIIDI